MSDKKIGNIFVDSAAHAESRRVKIIIVFDEKLYLT